MLDENINPYCSLDEKETGKKKSLGEMEAEYLNALQSFYVNGTSSISDEEFDNLKEELLWEGSKVATMSKDETLFLEAQKAYLKGEQMMSDKDFDGLKMRLKEQGSRIADAGPRCSLRSQKVYSDLSVDYLKLVALNVPAAVATLAALFPVDDLTGFEVTKAIELPKPIGPIIVWVFVLPFVYILSDAITNFVIRDALILKGACTNCLEEVPVFFGDILGVQGEREAREVVCTECKCKMSANAKTRQMVEVEVPKSALKKKKVAA